MMNRNASDRVPFALAGPIGMRPPDNHANRADEVRHCGDEAAATFDTPKALTICGKKKLNPYWGILQPI